MDSRSLSSAVLLGLLVISLASSVPLVALAQLQLGRIVEVKPVIADRIYPGEPVAVTVEVVTALSFKVKLCNAGCDVVWASRTGSASGTYLLTLPEKLPGAVDGDGDGLIDLWVALEIMGTDVDYWYGDVYPKVVVTPSSSTIVDSAGTGVTIKVRFLGYVPYDTISTVTFDTFVFSGFTEVTIGTDGTNETTVNLLDHSPGNRGIPRGNYKVLGVSSTGATNTTYAKRGDFEVKPQVVITPKEGNGRCDTTFCELTAITIRGYGFARDVRILRIDLFNINFTNVVYRFSFPPAVKTDLQGYFAVSNLKQYIAGGKGTNMTAGLYIPIVYEAPLPVTRTNTSTIPLRTVGTVVVSESAILAALGTRASVRATSYVDASLAYVMKASAMAYTLAEVLRIDIAYAGKRYQLAANLVTPSNFTAGTSGTVRFSLFNTTTVPFVTMFTDTTTGTYNATLGAFVYHVSFNIVMPPDYTLTPPPTPGVYRFWATFYEYQNQILLVLREWSLVVAKANLTITYTNRDTGTTVTRYYEYPKNMSIVDYRLTISPLTFTDDAARIRWTIGWHYDVPTTTAYLTVTGEPLVGPSFEFRNVYYIVRPLLVLLTPGAITPGMTVTIAAYGYGPGAAWGYPGFNTLRVYWEKIQLLGTFTLGKDGNLTFRVKIPDDATFGVHYIWGVDLWGYEYSLAIVVGARAYWYTGKVRPEVWAGYEDKRFEVCPCPESLGVRGEKYCALCATYLAKCDYLGDVIRVVVSGVSPGETLRVYFDGRLVLTAKANKSVEELSFVVPSVPAGTYTITVVGTTSGTIAVTDFFNTTKFVTASPVVVPKVLVLDLSRNVVPVLVGPGFVRIIGSGFPVGVSVYAVLFNGTDAAYALNAHVSRWASSENGILVSPVTRVLGIYVPALEPGAYAISLAYAMPDGTIVETVAGHVFVINNLSVMPTKTVIETIVETSTSEALAAISSKIDAAVADLRSRIDAAVGAISSKIDSSTDELSSKIDEALAAISSKIDEALAAISSKIDSSTDELSSKIDAAVGTISSKIDSSTASLSSKIDAAVGTISSKIDEVAAAVAEVSEALSNAVVTVTSKVDTVITKVDTISTNLKAVTDSLSAVTKDIGTIKTDVSSIKADVNTVKSDVADIKGIKTDVAGLKTDIAAVKSDVATVRSEVAAAKSDVAAVKTSVDAIPGRIDTTTTVSTVSLVFALLAFIMATLAFLTIRKVTGAPK